MGKKENKLGKCQVMSESFAVFHIYILTYLKGNNRNLPINKLNNLNIHITLCNILNKIK